MKTKLLFFLIFVGISLGSRAQLTVSAEGGTCRKCYFSNGAYLFSNRNYLINEIPNRFQGYYFLAGEGNVDEAIVVKAFGAGEVYLIAASSSLIEGWQKVIHSDFYYDDANRTKVSIFSCKVEDGDSFELPSLGGFVGATLLAERLVYGVGGAVMEAKGELFDISTVAQNEPMHLQNNERLFTSSTPSVLTGKQYAKPYADKGGVTHIRLFKPGKVYLLAFSKTMQGNQWRYTGTNFICGAGKIAYLFSYDCENPGQWVEIPQGDKNSVVLFDAIQNITHSRPPGRVIAHSTETKKHFITDPCIVILPNGDYVAGCRSNFSGSAGELRLFRSTDRGHTWAYLSSIAQVGFCNLFVLKNDLYVMGTKGGFNHCVIYRSTDNGRTWSNPATPETGLLLSEGKSYHSASVPVVVHNGRVWRTMEDNIPLGNRLFRAFVMSAPVDSDLLNASNWTISKPLPYETSWITGGGMTFGGWLEGNAVVTPDGKVVDFLRVHEPVNDGKAAIITISEDGKESLFDPVRDIVNFPGGCKKFVIRYDEVSRKYWSLVNHVLDEDRLLLSNCERIRNNVVLICSDDLRHWEVKDTLLRHPDVHYHAFQYIDWQFDGNDLIAVSRTAFDYDGGLPVKQHDGNYLTFHRFENFRSVLLPTSVSETSSTKSFIRRVDDGISVRSFEQTSASVSIATIAGSLLRQQQISAETHFGGLPRNTPLVVTVRSNDRVEIEKIIL